MMIGRKSKAPSNRQFFVIGIFVLLVALSCFGIAYFWVFPPPPSRIVMTTGREGGTYAAFGERYRQILAREKVHLELRPSSGSVENLRRLLDKSAASDVGFVQGGMRLSPDVANLVSLGAIGYTPLWVFYRSADTYDDLSQLQGKKITIGPEGSGVRKFALDLLKASSAADPPTQLLDLTSTAAVNALLEGKVDAIMTFGTADNALVQELLYGRNVKLMNFGQAEVYTRLFPDLSQVVLPKGILNLAKKIPASDVHLLAPTTNLVVRKNVHPALIYLLLDAAAEIHRGAGWVNRAGEFPAPKTQDIPVSDLAERFYKSGRPFLFDYLPFWVAIFVDRMILILLPMAVILLPMIRIIPWLYSWRNRRKFFRWYADLRSLDLEVSERPQPERMTEYRFQLDRIETAVNQIHVPLAFYRDAYALKEHINMVRGRLNALSKQALGENSVPEG